MVTSLLDSSINLRSPGLMVLSFEHTFIHFVECFS